MNHLFDLGECALAGCTKRYSKHIYGCLKLMLHIKCPFLGKKRPKGKFCQTVRMDQVGLKLY